MTDTQKGNDMKVFACKNQNSYGGGMILVAANTKEEAFYTASINKDVNHVFYEREYDSGVIVSDTYPLDEWFEVKHLSSDLAKPQVIIEDHYTE